MDNDKLKRWGSLVAFLVLAGISCWATEHSFHLLIKWIPQAFVWILTIAFFILASYGSKLILDSLNRDNYEEHRRRKFWIGVSLVLVFWFFMSMPTNTHTFFYNHKVADVVQDDAAITRGYVKQISDRSNIYPEKERQELYDKVNEIFYSLQREFDGTGGSHRKGGGELVMQHVVDMNNVLEQKLANSSIQFDPNKFRSKDPAVLKDLVDQKDRALSLITDKVYKVPEEEKNIADQLYFFLGKVDNDINIMKENGGLTEDFVTEADAIIATGYSLIKNDANYIKFKNDDDAQRYLAVNPETKTKRLLSVIDVWGDFLGGEYPASFIFYVLLSILIDLAAFMFFNFAFKKEN